MDIEEWSEIWQGASRLKSSTLGLQFGRPGGRDDGPLRDLSGRILGRDRGTDSGQSESLNRGN
jgi:hypothetical protein